MAITLVSNGAGLFGVAMEQIPAGIQYAVLHEENGTQTPNPNQPQIQLSPYAVQIAGGWNTQTAPYQGPLSINIERLQPGNSATADRYVLTGGADMVIWDRETTDGADYMFSLNAPSPATFDSRFGLPGLSGGDSGTFDQLAAIDVFELGAGNDLVSLVYNAQVVDGLAGVAYMADATIYGGAGVDVVWSGAGNDWLYGGDGADTLYGGAGNDTIEGGGSGLVDLLFGPDSVKGDLIDGGSGVNWVVYTGSAAAVNVILNNDQFGTATSSGGDADLDIIRRVNNLIGSSAGNDTLSGNTSANSIIGLGGNDTIYGGDDVSGGDVIYGDDVLNAVSGSDSIFGGAGNDTVYGGQGDDFIEGSAGADSLTGGTGQDTLSYSLSNAGVSVTLGGGGSGGHAQGDTVSTDFEHLLGSALDDLLRGSAIVNTIIGGLGADTIEGGAGADNLNGGVSVGAAGNGDWVSYEHSANGVFVSLLTQTAGNGGALDDADGDTIFGFANAIGSDAGGDTLYGGNGNNSIRGMGGNDTILGLGGADNLDGGVGTGDWVSYAGSAAVTVDLSSASPQVGGDAAGDVLAGFENLIGTDNNDSLTGTSGANTIYGGTGVDTIRGGAGADSLVGGGEGDWVSYAGSTSGVIVNLGLGTAQTGGDAQGDILSGFSNLIGSGQGDTLTGLNGINTIFGGGGDDSVVAGGGADFVTGDGGNDTLSGGAGADSLDGGAGAGDWVTYATSGSPVVVDLSLATAQTGGDAQGDILANIENLIGSDGSDSLTGSSGANTILGGAGVDTIEGGLGNDRLDGRSTFSGANEGDWLSYNGAASGVSASFFAGTATGGAGTDTISGFQHLLGSAGNDVLEGDDALDNSLVGQDGNDTLSGLGGIDTLFGGVGNDVVQIGNNGGTFTAINVQGWDGETGSGPISVALGASTARVGDYAFGGTGTDTVDLASLTSGATSTVYMRLNADGTPSSNSNIAGFIAGIEIIVAGAAADVINLTFNDGVTRSAYAENVTIFSAGGDDVVFSGSGNDLIVGGQSVSSTDGADTLYGGQGNDTLFGDDLNSPAALGGADRLFGGSGDDTADGGAGGDTLYGGSGFDSLSGGAGDDLVIDLDGGNLNGAEGADLLVLQGSSSLAIYAAHGGKDDVSDGDDQVFVGGTYNIVNSGLGGGNDRYISSSFDSGTNQIDRVSGESGNDLISTWYGNDTVDGGTGNDVIWGGAGSDTIYGGDNTDILYGGAGDGDVLVGGAGIDYYYWSRTDGVDMIIENDPNPVDPVIGARINALVVFPDWDTTELTAGSDQLRNGTGVFEVDHDLYDTNAGNGADMVQLVDIDGAGGSMYRLDIIAGAGGGTSSVTFDQRDVSTIILWNNDALGGTPVITQYVWDPVDQRYEFAG